MQKVKVSQKDFPVIGQSLSHRIPSGPRTSTGPTNLGKENPTVSTLISKYRVP